MKITINILPPEKKEALVLRRRRTALMRAGIMFVAILLFANGILGAVLFLLFKEKISAKEELAKIEERKDVQAVRVLEDEFRQVNGHIDLLQKIAEKGVRWASVVDKVGSMSQKQGIGLSEISLEGYVLRIAGAAPTRGRLLSLKGDFSDDVCFSSVEVPLADLVERSDVRFEISSAVSKDCVHKENGK